MVFMNLYNRKLGQPLPVLLKHPLDVQGGGVVIQQNWNVEIFVQHVQLFSWAEKTIPPSPTIPWLRGGALELGLTRHKSN